MVSGFLMLFVIAGSVRADYQQPEERPDDPKILSRDVKCQGKFWIGSIYLSYIYWNRPLSIFNRAIPIRVNVDMSKHVYLATSAIMRTLFLITKL